MSRLNRCTLFLTATILWLGPAQGQEWSRAEIRAEYQDAIVFLQIEEAGQTVSTGTGFVVSEDGYVLTNTHVVTAAGQIATPSRILGSTRSRYSLFEELTVIATDQQRDLALLRFRNLTINRSAVVVGDSNKVPADESVYAFGFPLEEDLSGNTGEIATTSGTQGRWRTSLALNPGNSGGPVFNTKGVVVGIAVSRDPRATLITHLIPSNYSFDLLLGHGVDFRQADSVPPPNDGPTLSGIETLPKVDALYKDEAIDLQFRSTPEQVKTYLNVSGSLRWNALRVAHEFQKDVVKFVNLDAKTANTPLPDWGCISSMDDLILFFDSDGRHELFRVSLRFWSTDECTEPEAWFSYFADSVGAEMHDWEDGRFFHAQGSAQGRSRYIMGWSDPILTIVDIGLLSFPSIAPEDWLKFIAEDLREPD